MTHQTLFELPPKVRVSHKAECEALKAKWGIQTHPMVRYTEQNGATRQERNWMAISMPMACRLLEGQDLTTEEKADLGALMAGYCRLLDDAHLIADGHKTEFEAVKAAAVIAEGNV